MLRVNKLFQLHVMRGKAKIKCFGQQQMTPSQKLIASKKKNRKKPVLNVNEE